MKLGTKLLAVILPPLLVLVVVAGLGAKDRLDTAADAALARDYVELGIATNAMVTTMQWERNLSLYVLAGGDGRDHLVERRERTDAEVARFRVLAEELLETGDPSLVPLIERSLLRVGATGRRSELENVRETVDGEATDVWIVQSFFANAIDDHLNLVSELPNTVPVAEVSGDLASFSALARAKEQAGRTSSALTVALVNRQFDPGGQIWRITREAESGLERYVALFTDTSPAELASTLRRALGSATSQRAEDMRLQIINEVAFTIDLFGDGAALGEPKRLNFNAAEWVDRSEARLNAMNAVGDDIVRDIYAYVDQVQTEAERTALAFLLATAVAVLLSGILAVVVARRVTKPLRELTVAADRLSGEQLPALVERLRNPSGDAGEVALEPIGMTRNDEIGRLADSFDSIQRVTVEVAEEQASLLRKGIGDIFVNLARRNQTLLDRQIEFIDQLESAEEDPDVLENLFKLDHLATRMRRNAESLLVLAGIETGHRRSRPVPLADVVRVAIGEVEDFARLSLLSLDDATVSGTAAMDVAHLLSELMENATSFSPPETNVEILGHRSNDGNYVISISDQGIGMSEDQFAEANRLLAEPPLVGLTLSRSLGFTVVGRLASRFDINVRLTSSPTGGVTALVTLPEAILQSAQISVERDRPEATAAPQPELPAAPAPERARSAFAPPAVEERPTEPSEPAFAEPSEPAFAEPSEPAFAESSNDVFAEPSEPAFADSSNDVFAVDPVTPEPEPQLPTPGQPAPDWVSPAPATSSLASAVPEGEAFDAGLAALMGEDTPRDDEPRQADEPVVTAGSDTEGPSLFSDAAMGPDANGGVSSEHGGVTSAGLVRRVPRAYSPGDNAERPGTATSTTSVAASQRSPEEVRAMLSRYRSGLQRAARPEDDAGPSGTSSDGSN